MLRRLLLAIVALTVATLSLLVALPASAAPAGWAAFEPLTGSSRDFQTTMQQRPAGFPAAAVTTDSVNGSSVGVQSGSSTFLGSGTEVGAKYGSSQGQPYMNLRPTRLNGNPPSTTTYVFERPTPSSGWTFVLGDVDADQVTITATDTDGAPVDPADFGFRSTFNYCAPGLTPKPTCGPPNNDGTSVPTWVEAEGLLRGNDAALDTAGAAAWFEPNVALSSLTFTFAQRSGAPIYQAWFAALQFDVAGTVTVDGGSDEGQTVRLYDPEGNLVGTTTTGADGTYSFPGRATYDNYRVELVRPDGFTSDGALSQRVDLSTGNRTDVDFSLRQIVPVPVSGTVTDVDGDPVAGVSLTLTDADDTAVATVTTDSAGNYLFDDVAVGNGYEITITTPDGFTADVPQRTFNVPANSETPIGGQDFVLTPVPTGSVAGTVTDGDGPRPGVVVTVTYGDDFERVLRTGDDGTYSLEGLPPGEYTVTLTAPTGTTIVGDSTVTATITGEGEDRTGLDFELAVIPVPSTYEASGTVLDVDDQPVADVPVTLTLPDDGGTLSATTDETGTFTFTDLEAGDDYAVSITPPGDYGVVDEPPATFDVADEDVSGLDFVVELQYDVSAAVTDTDGDPVPGAIVTLSDGESELDLITDESGTISFSGVPAGQYTATVDPPAGFVVPDGDDTQDVTVDDEDVQLTFVLEAEAVSPSPTTSPTTSSAPSSGPTEEPSATTTTDVAVPVSNGGGSLANTGGPSGVILLVGLGLLVVGGGVTLAGRLIGRRRAGAHQG